MGCSSGCDFNVSRCGGRGFRVGRPGRCGFGKLSLSGVSEQDLDQRGVCKVEVVVGVVLRFGLNDMNRAELDRVSIVGVVWKWVWF